MNATGRILMRGPRPPFFMIEQVLISKEKWEDFWTYFKGEKGQKGGTREGKKGQKESEGRGRRVREGGGE